MENSLSSDLSGKNCNFQAAQKIRDSNMNACAISKIRNIYFDVVAMCGEKKNQEIYFDILSMRIIMCPGRIDDTR